MCTYFVIKVKTLANLNGLKVHGLKVWAIPYLFSVFTQPPPRIYEEKNEIIEGVLFLDPTGMTYHAGPYPNHFITAPGIFTFN